MDNISLVSSFFKMIFALAIVLGLLMGVMYLTKKFMQQASPTVDSQALINIISSRYLGPKNSIILVDVMDKVIVVGISQQQMTTLACIDDPLTVARIKAGKDKSAKTNFPTGKIAQYLSMLNLPGVKPKDRSSK
jgi:flagellar biosynthetic protein FliO